VVRTLITGGARPEVRDRKQRTALHLLAQSCGTSDRNSVEAALQVLDLLVEAGIEVDAHDTEGATALLRAVDRRGAVALVDRLLARGADPLARNLRRDSVLDAAIRRGDPAIVSLVRDATQRASSPVGR
jgi:ankyrin repeat protein